MKKSLKKLASLLCAMALTLSLLPAGALAVESDDSGNSITLETPDIHKEAPSAGAVTVTGAPISETMLTGMSLTGSYTFSDSGEAPAGTEGVSTFRWLAADSVDGEYEAIKGATKKKFVLTDTQAEKYIKFEVTPMDGLGLAGDPVCSGAVGPVVINYVRNPGLDIETPQYAPRGWVKKNGGKFGLGPSAARSGRNSAQIPEKDADAEVSYAVTLPVLANYLAGAWIKTTSAVGTLGVRTPDGTVLASRVLPDTSGAYTFVTLPPFSTEANTKAEIFLQGTPACAKIDGDDFQITYQDAENLPEYVTLHEFSVENQIFCKLYSDDNTIDVTVPYGTDVSALEVTARVSEHASISLASGTTVDFSEPVTFTITNGSTSADWTATCNVKSQKIYLQSDNQVLEDGFNWAAEKIDKFVMSGKSGYINKGEGHYPGTPDIAYEPSYWAGYYDRTAFYSRDFVHQAVGGQIGGLWGENYNMFHTFAEFASPGRKWYTGWAFNFDGSIYTMDYKGDDNFVREVPAQFELVEKAYKQYLWSGDRRYIENETMWNFYTKVMTEFVDMHDTNGNGVAEGRGTGNIFDGSCTYSERSGERIIESGDAIGSQYQATLAYAAMLKERGEDADSAEWYQKAADLKTYFNEDWSIKDLANPNDHYVRAWGVDGTTRHNDFGKENNWFMPMKLITEPGPRNDAYLDFLVEKIGDHLGDGAGSPRNIEAWTYLPDTFFPYNRNDQAWKYMKYILSIKDEPHERPVQGTNGDYPEVSYTLLSHTIEGMMGIEADAANHKVVTAPRLPSEVGEVEAKYILMGEHELDISHDGLTKTTLINNAEVPLTWEARFYGTYTGIKVNGTIVPAQHKDVNGVPVSYAAIPVAANGSAAAEATNEENNIPSTPDSGSKGETVKNEDGSVTTTVTDKKTGTVTETTKMPNGTELKVETKTDGSVTTLETRKDGTKVESETAADGNTTATVTVPKGTDRITVTIPTPEKPKPGQVVVIIKEDGTKEIIKTAVSTEDGMRLSLDENAKLEIIDNSKSFTDVADRDWFHDAVEFSASREIFTGTGKETFSPGEHTTRATLFTALARLDGQDTTGGGQWYEKGLAWAKDIGVSDGANPEENISREGLATMLYRYAKTLPGYTQEVGVGDADFTDRDDISPWASDAMRWAVETGILQGNGGKLNPGSNATRGEVATMLQRFVENMK